MSTKDWVSVTVLCLLAVASRSADPSDPDKEPTAPMNERVLAVPGDPARPVTLQVTVFSPPGSGPFPLAVMNHGASGKPRDAVRYRQSFMIDYLLSRGFAVVVPMMRGFAGSGGSPEIAGCDFVRMAQQNGRDILAVIRHLALEPDIDATRVVVAGQSFGGWNALGVGSLAPDAVVGLLNVVGGVTTSACDTADSSMADAADHLGRSTRVPSLWVYADNDELFPERVWRRNLERYTRAGGRATLVDVGTLRDAHNLLGHGEWLDRWVPAADRFLAGIGLPHVASRPEYLPTVAPSATNYAEIDDLSAIPFLTLAQSDFHQKFLNRDFPRALVISPTSVISEGGGFDPIERALRKCRQTAKICMLYAVDDHVVWTGPPAGASATIKGVPIHSREVDAGGQTVLEQFVNLNSNCTAIDLPAVEVADPKIRGTVSIHEPVPVASFPAASPFAACATTTARVLRIQYRAVADFEGTEFVTLAITRPGEEPHRVKFAVTVRRRQGSIGS